MMRRKISGWPLDCRCIKCVLTVRSGADKRCWRGEIFACLLTASSPSCRIAETPRSYAGFVDSAFLGTPYLSLPYFTLPGTGIWSKAFSALFSSFSATSLLALRHQQPCCCWSRPLIFILPPPLHRLHPGHPTTPRPWLSLIFGRAALAFHLHLCSSALIIRLLLSASILVPAHLNCFS